MIKIDIRLKIGYTSSDIVDAIASALPIGRDEITSSRLLRRTLDLVDGKTPSYKCTVAFSASEEREAGLLKIRNRVKPYVEEVFSLTKRNWDFRPVVVGAGPAGLFAALILAESGAAPIVIERGECVSERRKRVELFNTLGILDPESNVQFGEGGAGTFSDGKLKVGARDPYKLRVLYEFISSGATDDIAFSSTAHLGTDKLGDIIASLRERIEALGAEVIFGAKLSSLSVKDGELCSLTYIKNGQSISIPTKAVILAIGHSAGDTIRMLYDSGVRMESRPFGVGVRIEHKREYIDRLVWRDSYDMIDETASYHLVTHLKNGRSVYSFCMCPGGTVVAAASEEHGIVTNGMSEFARMADNSNAALLVSVTPEDFGSDHPLAGIDYQRSIERAAFTLTNSYKAPSMSLGDLMRGCYTGAIGDVTPSYSVGTVSADIGHILPEYITQSLRMGILDFDAWMSGYNTPEAVLTAPETRTTSPVRMTRSENGEAIGNRGIFPAGEGAGYAGGIVSSATDGIRQAEKLVMQYSNEAQTIFHK